METLLIGIGRNVGAAPMTQAKWDAFKSTIDSALLFIGPVIFRGEGIGQWEGKEEAAVQWIVLAQDGLTMALRDTLSQAAADFAQDAIAVTVLNGTEFIGSHNAQR